MLVAVRGRVHSGFPKKCELSDKLAVVHEVSVDGIHGGPHSKSLAAGDEVAVIDRVNSPQIVEEEIWRKTRENGRVVNEPFEVKRSSDRSEWFLVGDSGGRPDLNDGPFCHGQYSCNGRSFDAGDCSQEDGMSPVRVKVDNVAQAERLSSVLQTTQVFVPEDNSKISFARMLLDKSW